MNFSRRPGWMGLLLVATATSAQGSLLQQVSVSVLNSGGAGGSGANTTDMVFAQFGSDGWGFAGGAGGVQGTGAVTNGGGSAPAANEALKFNVGSTIDTLNTTYGAGNWTIDNPTFNFASSYSIQNNSRFGRGTGTFDIYWAGNDNWAQSTGTVNDRQLNPIYAGTPAGLLAWSGSQSLLGSETFTIPTAGSGFVNLSYPLFQTSPFVSDIITASASGANQSASLYLMGTNNTLGMIIFTGGQAQALPTLKFDVVSVPEPAAMGLVAMASAFLLGHRRHRP